MLYRVTYVDYDTGPNEEVRIRLGGRDEEGNRRTVTVTGKNPYIFAPIEEQIATDDDRVVKMTSGYESYDGTELVRLDLTHPKYANRPDKFEDSIRNDYSVTYESDIRFYRRCAVDGLIGHIDIPSYKTELDISDIELDPEFDEPIEPRICIADIEVLPDYDVPFNQMKEEAKQPLICTTMWDSYKDKYTIIAQDPDGRINTGEVKDHLGEHWQAEDNDYTDAPMRMVRVKSDREMAEAIKNYFSDTRFDLVSGWNFVDFDLEYIIRYLDNQEVNTHALADVGQTKDPEWASGGDDYPSIMERAIEGLPALDMMIGFTKKMSFHNWRSKALDYVSDEVLGMGKVKGIDFTETFENNYSKLIAYNIIDVQLLVAMDRQKEIFDFFYNLADLCSIPIYDTFYEKRQVDGYILSRRTAEEVLPIQSGDEAMGNAGGLVLEQQKGIEEWVGVFDLKSLYPSCIITCNISPETMGGGDVVIPSMPASADDVGGHISEDDIDWDNPMHTFSLEKEGIIPKYVKQLFVERAYYKSEMNKHEKGTQGYNVNDQRQRSVKVLMNSFYGVSSSPYWRLSVPGLGDSVTGAGRYVLWYGAHYIRQVGYPVAYGDTDSVMLNLRDGDEEFDVEKAVLRGRGICSEINTKMNNVAEKMGIGEKHPFLADSDLHGSDRHALMWEFEKLFRRMLLSGKKKRYAGHMVWEEGEETDEIKITGFESQRSDSTETAATAQEEVMDTILKEGSFESVSEYVQGIIDDIQNDFTIREHALPSVINKDITEYPNGPRKKGVMYSNEYLDSDWKVGDSPWLVYVNSSPPGLPKAEVIALDWTDEVPDGFSVNNPKMIEKNLEQPLSTIINIAGYDWREVKSGRRTQSLASGGGSTDNPFSNSDYSDDEGEKSSLSQW